MKKNVKMEVLPPPEFLHDDECNPTNGKFSCSAVFPSLPLALSWLRNSARDNPSLKLQVYFLFPIYSNLLFTEMTELMLLQVLVTGSLHLVGDVLKLLRR